ncbi:MAG: hypothetical protein A2V45_14490 [Candidatus Aminicenantes bacterium RBG_19FT_COMBO_58_17]|nr:MAG: hypothetical protein A2V45_14490 [Candidatus Aminicenantes bacterium RBG_19FT_COMBO_58_17]
MAEETWRGDLTTTSFPQVIFRIWEKRDSGRLLVRSEEAERSLCFINGDLALAEGLFSGEGFLKKLLSVHALTALQAEECAGYARENTVSYPRAIIERGIIPPSRVWESLADFWMEELFAVFDWTRADLTFDPDSTVPDAHIYALVPTPAIVLRGIRRMKKIDLIGAFLPAETESLQLLSPAHADHLHLAPHEKHVLGMLRVTPRLGDLYAQSQAGKRETQKAVFAFLTLGLAGLAPTPNPAKPAPELSSAGLERIWIDFNDKCSYIYRYISKEIGPVGLSVLEKSLEDIRARLAPPFQGLELRADGRVEFSPFPLMSLNLFTEETRKYFIRVLNEILTAEVLAVKKTLGNAHEAGVVKSLERIGEPH